MKALSVRGEVFVTRGFEGKDKDGNFFGRVNMAEMGVTHEVTTNESDLFQSVPKAGQMMVFVGELEQKLSAGTANEKGKAYVNKSYELRLVSLTSAGAGQPGSSLPPSGRPSLGRPQQ